MNSRSLFLVAIIAASFALGCNSNGGNAASDTAGATSVGNGAFGETPTRTGRYNYDTTQPSGTLPYETR